MPVQSGQKFPSLNSIKAIPGDTGAAVVASVLVSFGTVTLNGVTPVTVANPAVTANSIIIFTLKTVGGTVSSADLETVTPGTGFTVQGSASDTSTYSYVILG